ncbi:MAG: hypothetical protein HC913_17490 [Microscillaceae bacterium]|nr:hypothetical protein [Microscillaceae bacterium]
MQKSIINQLILRVQEAFDKLNLAVPISVSESLALFVYKCMIGKHRTFHTPEHVLKVCNGLQHPIQILATLFHDVVYFQVDDGFGPETSVLLEAYVVRENQTVKIKSDFPQDEVLRLCLDVFDYQPGDEVRTQGFNEFLSTLVGIHLLPYLSQRNLLGIMVGIEGTIPFRGRDEAGKNCFERMEYRLGLLNDKYQLGIKPTHIDLMLQLAVEIANKDVENFSEANVAEFLDNTWRLLPETNNHLALANVYTVRSYRQALQKIEAFMNFVPADYVFQQYRQTPDELRYQQMKAQAQENIDTACEYLQAKLASIAILEALAQVSGGDAPMSMFIGDLRHNHALQAIERAEDYLPAVALSDEFEYNPAVLKLLEFGRASILDFDMQNAPISYFVYASLGKAHTMGYLQLARQMFEGQIKEEDYLAALPTAIRSALSRACAQVSVSRKEALKVFF